MPRRRFQPGISNHPKPRGRPTRFPRFIQESRFLSNLPIAEEAVLPIFLLTSKQGIDEHKIYRLGRNSNSLTLISTNQFGIISEQFGFGPTAKRLGKSHYLLISDTLYRSKDQCVSWEAVRTYSNFDNPAFAIDAGGRVWFIAVPSGGGFTQTIQYSDDDGDTWVTLETSFVLSSSGDFIVFEIVPHPTDPGTIICVGFYARDNVNTWGVLYTTNRGDSWDQFSLPDTNPDFSGFEIKCALFTEAGRFITIVQNSGVVPNNMQILYSDDPTSGVGSFTRVILGAPIGDNGATDWFNPVISLSSEGRKTIAFATETHEFDNLDHSAHIWLSIDEGQSWDELDLWPVQIAFEDINSGFYDADNDRLIIITTGASSPGLGGSNDTDDGKIWVSKPPGQNWVEITPEEDLGNPGSAFMVIWR